eukprot:UN02056
MSIVRTEIIESDSDISIKNENTITDRIYNPERNESTEKVNVNEQYHKVDFDIPCDIQQNSDISTITPQQRIYENESDDSGPIINQSDSSSEIIYPPEGDRQSIRYLAEDWVSSDSSDGPELLGGVGSGRLHPLYRIDERAIESLTKTRIFLSKSSARDKLCGFVQYASLILSEMGNNKKLNTMIILRHILSPERSKIFFQLERALSKSRKGFRLLKFITELEKGRMAVVKRKSIISKIAASLLHGAAVGYFFLDNWIFLEDVFNKSGRKNNSLIERLKFKRNLFSLVRTILAT